MPGHGAGNVPVGEGTEIVLVLVVVLDCLVQREAAPSC
jgi:hypothetical protein